jgi:hypothetical protein
MGRVNSTHLGTNRSSEEMSRMKLKCGRAVLAAMVASGALLVSAAPAAAQEKVVAIRLEEQDNMASVLKRLEGRAVKIRLVGSGDEIAGKVQKVGKDVVHVSDIGGREFFDSMIRIDQVSAVIVQVRGR